MEPALRYRFCSLNNIGGAFRPSTSAFLPSDRVSRPLTPRFMWVVNWIIDELKMLDVFWSVKTARTVDSGWTVALNRNDHRGVMMRQLLVPLA